MWSLFLQVAPPEQASHSDSLRLGLFNSCRVDLPRVWNILVKNPVRDAAESS